MIKAKELKCPNCKHKESLESLNTREDSKMFFCDLKLKYDINREIVKNYKRDLEERNGIIKILENLSFDEKKEVLRIVDQSMINSANNVLANDDPPGKPLKRLPTKHKSEVQAKAVQMGRQLFIKIQVDELIKRRRRKDINVIK